MLIDAVEITLKSGKGGNGMVAWRREKHVPMGGPDGGDGGRGGSTFLVADHNLDTLSSFRYRKVFQAEDGQGGMSKKKNGRAGEDLVLPVPVGTVVSDSKTGQVLADLLELNQRIRVARGGQGGLGNPHFASATNQTPQESTAGQPGETRLIKLELKLIADVALVGMPNAGKSSIINCLTQANSRIGAFAFSTREPILGVMEGVDQKILLIDLPGLLEGAHVGKGLGDEFLKHTQRVRAIVHVVDVTQPDPQKAINIINHELDRYDSKLTKLPSVIVLNKIDLLSADELVQMKKLFPQALFISAQAKDGTDTLRQSLIDLVA